MFKEFLAFTQPHLPPQGRTLLAVSGGVDSVVMSALFRRAKIDIAIAHCNFGLRGTAADQDEAFVQTLAQQYNVPFHSKTFRVQAQGQSVQMAARTLRYAWFETLCQQHGYQKVATAHHQNDVLETVLLHLAKGTSIAGLRGIKSVQGPYIRPLHFATKADICQYARANNLTWREDHTNQKDDYQRNLIRNHVIPHLKKINPSLEKTFRLTAERLSQIETLYNQQLDALQQQHSQQHPTHYSIDVCAIAHQPWAPVVLWDLLKPYGFAYAPLRALLAQAPTTGAKLPAAAHTLYVDRGQWIITPNAAPPADAYSVETTTHTLRLPSHTLRCTQLPRAQYTIVPDKAIAALDYAKLQFPLTIRPWQPGDTFCPLGMQQHKKISDYLIDNKIPRPHKATVHVLISGQEIVWVIGHRIDHRFRITPHTQHVYHLQLQPQTPATSAGT